MQWSLVPRGLSDGNGIVSSASHVYKANWQLNQPHCCTQAEKTSPASYRNLSSSILIRIQSNDSILEIIICSQIHFIDGLAQERCNSIANALELRLSCTNPSIWCKSYFLSLKWIQCSSFIGTYGTMKTTFWLFLVDYIKKIFWIFIALAAGPGHMACIIHGPYDNITSWWCHPMETFSAFLALCEGNPLVTGGFPALKPVMQSFDVFFDLCLNKRWSK